MDQRYSEDLRDRALACADRGETIRSIAAALEISPSCVSKCRKLRRETGALKPGKMKGHKKPVLRGPNADWLRERVASGPFTVRSLTAALAARGVKTHQKSVWLFLRAQGLSFKKNCAAG